MEVESFIGKRQGKNGVAKLDQGQVVFHRYSISGKYKEEKKPVRLCSILQALFLARSANLTFTG